MHLELWLLSLKLFSFLLLAKPCPLIRSIDYLRSLPIQVLVVLTLHQLTLFVQVGQDLNTHAFVKLVHQASAEHALACSVTEVNEGTSWLLEGAVLVLDVGEALGNALILDLSVSEVVLVYQTLFLPFLFALIFPEFAAEVLSYAFKVIFFLVNLCTVAVCDVLLELLACFAREWIFAFVW
jgi:hypothetical protein